MLNCPCLFVFSLHDVLDEFYSLRKPTPTQNVAQSSDTTAEDSRNFLASRLGQVMIDENKKAGGSNGSSQHHNQQGVWFFGFLMC